MSRFPTALFLPGFLATVALAAGCGSDANVAPVTGTVTYKGEPLKQGTITFVPENGRPGNGKIVDGQIVEVTLAPKKTTKPTTSTAANKDLDKDLDKNLDKGTSDEKKMQARMIVIVNDDAAGNTHAGKKGKKKK